MSRVVHVGDLADLVAAGIAVTTHGEDLAARHLTVDGMIGAALPGWRGRSAVALGALADQWTTTTTAVLARLREHAAALHTAAAGFAEHEQRAAAGLAVP